MINGPDLLCFQNLLRVDRYPYEANWELDAADAIQTLYQPLSMVEIASSTIVNGSTASPAPDNSTLRSALAPSATLASDCLPIDLRSASDYKAQHLDGAINIPLRSLTRSAPSPFADADVLETQWLELEELFASEHAISSTSGCTSESTASASSSSLLRSLKGKRVVLVCYTGDTSFVATSVLRAKGVEAYSVRGGARSALDFMMHVRHVGHLNGGG